MRKRMISLLLITSVIFTLISPTITGAQEIANASSEQTYSTDGAYNIGQSVEGQSSVSNTVYGSVYQQNSVLGNVYGQDTTIETLIRKYQVDASVIYRAQLQGYTLQEIEQALQFQQTSDKDLASILDVIRPRNLTPTDDSQFSAEGSDSFSTSYDKIAEAEVHLKPDNAPFTLQQGNEQISTLTGGVSTHADDLTLPGRNGLSFTLSRIYSSDSAAFFKSEVEFASRGSSFCSFNYDGYYYKQQIRNGVILSTSSLTPNSVFKSADTFQDYTNWMDYITRNAGKDITYSDEVGSDGTITRYISGVAANPNLRNFNVNTSNTGSFRNKNWTLTSEEQLFHIGVGWRWNIPYVDSGMDGPYVHFADGSSYAWGASGNVLIDYPNNDVSFGYTNAAITVNGEKASTVLSYKLMNINYYFNYEGRLIEIVDAYGNTIQFMYQQHSTYGKVLNKITDAIGNSIEIQYTDDQVTLTKGNQRVVYHKDKQYNTFPDYPWENKTTDILSSVTDVQGHTTKYSYDFQTSTFNLLGKYVTPLPIKRALLNKVEYPTDALTVYTYEHIYRNSESLTSFHGAYRITSREDQMLSNGSMNSYNHQSYDYENDMMTATTLTHDSWGSLAVPHDVNFKTIITDRLNNTTIVENVRHYHNILTPSGVFLSTKTFFYQLGSIVKSDNLQLKTNYKYDMDHDKPAPIEIKTQYANSTSSSSSTPVITTKTYDSYGNVLTETDPNNAQTRYTYTSLGLLSTITKPLNANLSAFTEYVRNAQGSVMQVTVKDNNANGTLRSQVNYSYDQFGNPVTTTVKDTQGSSTIGREYNNNPPYNGGFLTKQTVQVTDVDGVVDVVSQGMDYDTTTGALKTYTDGKGQVTSLQHDNLGRVTNALYPDASSVSLEYDDIENKITTVDQTGLTTVTQWNPLGWKISEGIKDDGFTTYGYDAYGRLKWSEDALKLNHRTNFNYDGWNRIIQTQYPDGSDTKIAYDDVNLTRTTTDPENNWIRETYDLLNRITKKEWLKSTRDITLGSYTYDYVGNVLTSKDGNANKTTYTYDVLNRLTSVTDDHLQTTSYTYSLANKLTEIQHPDGNKENKQYDELGRLMRKQDSAGLIDKYYYDGNNNLSKYVDRKGQFQTYEYTDRNLLKNSVSKDETISYTYDGAGRRLTMQDATGLTSYHYHPVTKRLETLTYPDQKTIKYEYDLQGNRKKMIDPFVNTTVYDYDVRNRLQGVGPTLNNWDASYTYKKNDLLETEVQLNGMSWNYGYDGANLIGLTQQKLGGAVIGSYSYGYDDNSNQTSRTENGVPHSFEYDWLNRIEKSTLFNEQYSYDARGNRQILQSNNMINLNGTGYAYDDRNRLTQVSKDEGKQVSYRYNGDGLLYERTENGVTTRYYYDGANLIAEGTVSGGTVTLKARYIRGNGLVARADAGGNKQYYLQNGHGDVVGLTDANGNTLNQYTYDLWGKPLTTQEVVAQPFRYSGEFWDDSTGLQYLRARWYDPSVGRFINEDTYEGKLDNPLSLNLYTYVYNNPLKYTDPTGHDAAQDWLAQYINGYKQQAEYIMTGALNALADGANTVLFVAGELANGIEPPSGEYFKQLANFSKEARVTSNAVKGAREASEYASSAAQYQRLKNSLAKEEIQSVIKTTEHGAERLMSRGFSPSDISDLKLSPSKILTQTDGASVFIKNIGAGKFNVVVESENGAVTALKNISENSLNRLSQNYGWK